MNFSSSKPKTNVTAKFMAAAKLKKNQQFTTTNTHKVFSHFDKVFYYLLSFSQVIPLSTCLTQNENCLRRANGAVTSKFMPPKPYSPGMLFLNINTIRLVKFRQRSFT